MRMVVANYPDAVTIDGLDFHYSYSLLRKDGDAPIAVLRLSGSCMNKEEELGALFKDIAQVFEKHGKKYESKSNDSSR